MEFLILEFGAKELEDQLLMAGEAAVQTLPVMEEIQTDMFRVEEAIFSSGGRRGGGSWAQLKPDTIKKKNSSKILVDTGALKDSVTQPGAQFQILEITNLGIMFGTDRPWAVVQQTGSSRVPARPFIRFLPNDVNRWTGMIARHIMKNFKVST